MLFISPFFLSQYVDMRKRIVLCNYRLWDFSEIRLVASKNWNTGIVFYVLQKNHFNILDWYLAVIMLIVETTHCVVFTSLCKCRFKNYYNIGT